MSQHSHAVVWLDHREARVFHFNVEDVAKLVIHPEHPTRHIHHKANTMGSGHAPADHEFLHSVAQALAGTREVLVTGPANAKTQLMAHLETHDPAVHKCVLGVETVDHPTDRELVAHARKYFEKIDRVTPQ